jgi:putative tricarboxylic transport membrane protein
MDELPKSIVDPQSDRDAGEQPTEPLTPWQRWGELLIAATVLGLGALALTGAQDIRVSASAVQVSPRLIPQIIGVGLLVVGGWYTVEIIRRPYTGHGEESEDFDPSAKTDWTVLAIIAAGLVCYAILMEFAGFVTASAALFFISALAMGSRSYLRDAAIAIALAVAIFLVFDTWLGVRLPAGVFSEWLSM